MNSLYLECRMGAAGDMLCAALYELCDERQKAAFLSDINAMGLPGVHVSALPETKCGIRGTRLVVDVHGHEEGDHHGHNHPHDAHGTHLSDIRALIDGLRVPSEVREDAHAVYRLLADSEANAHGTPVELVHFHEVGALDAVADIVGFSLLIHMLGIRRITASPVHTGSGQVRTAHGVLPVPAPATALLLTGIPAYSDGTEGELCTPTGAALLKHFASAFGPMPAMATKTIGYGMGKKDFPAANCVRAFLGETQDAASADSVAELRCNIDDMTPEAIGFVTEALLAAGVKDVYVQPVFMKKNRPGFVLVCLCAPEDADKTAALLLRHTTTLGVRKFACERYILDRDVQTTRTSLGEIRVKRASGYGVSRAKPEYEDVARAAREHGLPFAEAYAQIERECGL